MENIWEPGLIVDGKSHGLRWEGGGRGLCRIELMLAWCGWRLVLIPKRS